MFSVSKQNELLATDSNGNDLSKWQNNFILEIMYCLKILIHLIYALSLHIQSNVKQFYKLLIFIAIEGTDLTQLSIMTNLIQNTARMCKESKKQVEPEHVKVEVGTSMV